MEVEGRSSGRSKKNWSRLIAEDLLVLGVDEDTAGDRKERRRLNTPSYSISKLGT